MQTKARSFLFAFLTIIALGGCRRDGRDDGAAATRASAGTSSTSPPSGPTVTRPPPPPAGLEELALIAPLGQGDDLGGFALRDVRGVEDGLMRIVCVKDGATVRLDIALVDDEGPAPPATAGRYAIYYSIKGATPEDGDRLAKKLAAVIAAHPDAPPPRGMTRFTPRAKPGTAL